MENKIKRLFEYQKFEQNGRLAKLIAETEARQTAELSDDELELVAAAGEMFLPNENDEAPDDK
ncbi:MAG: hypothetical protein MJ147_09485 [Clostridia bacterium]|nr:hypothetical protein [Clostridia bacterium]